MADALALASKGGPELILKTQMKYFEVNPHHQALFISSCFKNSDTFSYLKFRMCLRCLRLRAIL